MADSERPLLQDVGRDIARLRAELGEMLGLRWQLARLELDAAVASVKRLAVLLAVAVVMVLTALPLAVVAAAEFLNGVWGISSPGWLIGFFVLLILGAGLTAWMAWRRFRAGYVGFEETLEELHEDVLWFRELTDRPSDADDPEE